MRYPDYNTQSVWKRIDQMLTEHFVNNPQDCKNSEAVAEELYNESQYQKWLKKPIHTFGTEIAFDMFNEAVNRAVCLVKSNYDAVDYNNIKSKNDWEADPVSINESAYYAPDTDFFTEGVTDDADDADDEHVVKIKKPVYNTIGDQLTAFFECEEQEWYQEAEETLSIADIFNFQKKNNMKYIEATGIFDNEKNNELKIRVNKGSSHCEDNSADYELAVSDGNTVTYFTDYNINIAIDNNNGDIELAYKGNQQNDIFFKVKINEPIINITDEDELEPPGIGSFL